MDGTAGELLRQCREAHARGVDFPTIWNSLLRPHELVVGLPIQDMGGGRAQLLIQLVTGQRLVFDSASREFDLK